MEHYLDDDGVLRCADCGMPKHKNPSCDKIIKRNFERHMTRVTVKNGSERVMPDRSHKGRI